MKRLDGLAHGVDAVDVGRGAGEVAVGQQLAHDRQQHGRVGTGPHEVVLVGDLGRLGAARVDDDQPPSARGELAPALGEVGHRPQRPVRRHRVVADEHEQVGAVDVGDGQEELVAVERPRHDVVRQLVDRGGGEPVPGAQQPHERRVVGQGAEAVDVGVALVDRHRVVAVLALHGGQRGCRRTRSPRPRTPRASRRRPCGAPVGGAGRGPRGRPAGRTPWGRCARARAGRPRGRASRRSHRRRRAAPRASTSPRTGCT